MKKNIKNLLFIMAVFMCSMISVKADGPSITCPSSAKVGEVFKCTITTDRSVIVATDLKVYKGSTSMNSSGSIELKANEDGKYDVSLADPDDPEQTVYDTKTVVVSKATTTTTTTTTKKSTTTTTKKSDNNYLSKILIDGEMLEDFDKDTTKYTLSVDYDTKKVSVKAVAEDENAKVEIENPSKLEVGDNTITISVLAADGSTKYYKITVNRKDKEESSNAKLKSIKIDGYKLDFDANSKTFYLKINNEDSELDISAKPADSKATVKITGNENLEDGSIIKILVTATDGTKSTYRIIIEKKESSPLPLIIGLIIGCVVLGIVIFVVIQNKNNKKKNNKKKHNNSNSHKKKVAKANKEKEGNDDEEEYDDYDDYDEDDDYDEEDDDDETEKTIRMKLVDNDEDEKTRMLSYEEAKELEKTKVVGDYSSDDNEDEEDTFGI